MGNTESAADSAHFVILGWGEELLEKLIAPIVADSEVRFSCILHPRVTARSFIGKPPCEVRFIRADDDEHLPSANDKLLAELEAVPGAPSIHNMIMGDSIVAKLPYPEALRYATFLAQRIERLLTELRPTAVVGAFDALHGAIGYAVAGRLGIPWFALHFSVIPTGFACFVDTLMPASRIQTFEPDPVKLRALAEGALTQFEARSTIVPAYIPEPRSLPAALRALPRRMRQAVTIARRRNVGEMSKFVEHRSSRHVVDGIREMRRVARRHGALARARTRRELPSYPFVLFGLHMQPESSIDVWAPFFANQIWVIELLARSIPPTHRLMVKIHKSDVARYSGEQLSAIQSLPGVELVHPSADTRGYVERADLIVAIQGTIGLEAALLGKSVLLLADSPVECFPSVTRIGKIWDLPALLRRMLRARRPSRAEILAGYETFLRPFEPAAVNDWTVAKTETEIAGFVSMFANLRRHVDAKVSDLGKRVES